MATASSSSGTWRFLLPMHRSPAWGTLRPEGVWLRPLNLANAFPFAGLTSCTAKYVSQRITQTHTRHQDDWLQTATDKVLPSTAPTYRTHIKHKHRQPRPFFCWQTQEVNSAGMHMELSGFTSTHIFVDLPSTITTSLSARHPCLDPRHSYLPHGSPTCWLVQLDAH